MSMYKDPISELLDGIGDIDFNDLLKEHPPTQYPECLYGEMNPFYGKKHTEETKKYLSGINLRENHPNYGKPLSEETKKKISLTNTGKKHSDISRKKMSESAKKRDNNNLAKWRSEGHDCWNKGNIGFLSDRIWINNGIENKRIVANIIPEGYELGRLPYTHKTTVECPYCGVKGKKGGSMSRWHFENCKKK